MSVAPVDPASCATSAATRLSLSMLCDRRFERLGVAGVPSFAAVAITPVPSGLDRNSRWPAPEPALDEDALGMDAAGDAEAVLGLGVHHRVAARDNAACLAHLVGAALEDGRDDVLGHLARESPPR